jgi:DnaK suppressor protein
MQSKTNSRSPISQNIIQECRHKLILLREELLNSFRSHRLEVSAYDKMSGDEVDQTAAQAMEDEFAIRSSRIRKQLVEVDFALARIQKGEFGICEETQEAIEAQRLLAIPYTRLSLEGAEIREAMKHRFAHE